MGGSIGYFSGDPLRLLEDAQILRPSYFPSVPRVLNRVYAGAAATMAGTGLKSALLRKAVETKLTELHRSGINTHALWDRVVFKKVIGASVFFLSWTVGIDHRVVMYFQIQALLGGNVKMITSGSAPISPEVIDFLKIAFACDVIEGMWIARCTLPLDVLIFIRLFLAL